MTAKSTVKKVVYALLMTAATLLFTLFAYAYFTAAGDDRFNASVNIELLFDRLDRGESEALAQYQKLIYDEKTAANPEYIFDPDGDGTANTAPDGNIFDPNIKWGSEYNPYVISDVRHLQNLSTLTNSGYFKRFFNSEEDTTNVPHFLISTPQGKSVVIDATGITLTPIGSDLYPFLGSVRGGVLDGEDGAAIEIDAEGQSFTAKTSTVYNLTVSASSGYHDIGMFGYIGYTGTVVEGQESFEGTPSRIEDILLADVRVRTTHSFIDDLTAWLDHASHAFKLFAVDGNGNPADGNLTLEVEGNTYTIFRETHHIGILAGHADYATVKNVSLFYSSDDICAIDISCDADNANVNYYSHTGILGTLNHLNSATTIDAHGVSFIKSDGGISDENVSYGFSGGGGLLSGKNPGYILAQNMFALYSYNADSYDEDGDIFIYLAKDEEGNNLCVAETREILWWESETGNYYFTDGVFTFALSSKEDTIEQIWKEGIPSISYGPNSDGGWEFREYPNRQAYKYTLELVDFSDLPDTDTVENDYGYLALLADSAGRLYVIDLAGTSSSSGGMNVVLKDTAQLRDAGTGAGYFSISDITEAEGGKFSFVSSNKLADSFSIVKSRLNSSTFAATTDTSKSFGIGAGYYKGLTSLLSEERFAAFSSNSSSYKDGSGVLGYYTITYTIKYDHTRTGDAQNGFEFSNSVSFTSGGNQVTRTLYPYVGSGQVSLTQTKEDVGRIYFVHYSVDNQTPGSYVHSSNQSFSADSYVLWPRDTYEGSEVWSAGSSYDTDTYKFSKDDESYVLVPLSQLGWRDMNGQNLTDGTHTNRMFNMAEGIKWGVAANILGLSIGTDGLINASVGSDGTKYNIPTGCIAFKVNELTNTEVLPDGSRRSFGKIRVIAAVPSTTTNINPSGEDCFFGIWKGGNDTSSGISVDGFQRRNAQELFRMPMSFYCDDSGASNSPYTTFYLGSATTQNLGSAGGDGNRTSVSANDNTLYRAYLSGQVALMAYEFEVDELGSYIIGASNANMQIVYFSADGVASEGNDGTGKTGQLGALDFVYANGDGEILTVDMGDTDGSAENPSEYYYPSYWLVHLNNRALADTRINNERIYIYRYLDNNQRYVNVALAGDGHVAFSPYHTSSDNTAEAVTGVFPNRREDP